VSTFDEQNWAVSVSAISVNDIATTPGVADRAVTATARLDATEFPPLPSLPDHSPGHRHPVPGGMVDAGASGAV
jgi:hypothetical protein